MLRRCLVMPKLMLRCCNKLHTTKIAAQSNNISLEGRERPADHWAYPMSNLKTFFSLPPALRASFTTPPSSCAKLTWRRVQSARFAAARDWQRYYGTRVMTNTSVELTAPNGRKYTQPIGLFIDNEWHPSSNGEKITSINPTFVYLYWLLFAK